MSFQSVTQSKKEPSLKDVLTTILDDFGFSKQGVCQLICLLDTNIESVVDKNDKYLFKFKNTEIHFDFGTQINDSIKSSCIMIYLNNFLDLKKIELHFLTGDGDNVIIANYNKDYEFIDLKYDNPEMKKIKERIKIEHDMDELKKLERQKKTEEVIIFNRIETNKKIISALQSKLKILNDNEKDFEYICNKFLLTGCKYEEWKINNFKNFTIRQSDGRLSIDTNIFNTDIFPKNSSYFIQKCTISFDYDIKIASVSFVIKQIKIGNYWIYSFRLDSNFDLNKISRLDMATGQKMKNNDQCCNGVTFEEIVSILKFKLSNNDSIYEIIPEVIVPSVYDFNSEDFKKRLLIAEMLLV